MQQLVRGKSWMPTQPKSLQWPERNSGSKGSTEYAAPSGACFGGAWWHSPAAHPPGSPCPFQDLPIGMKERYYIGVTNKDPEENTDHPALAGHPHSSSELMCQEIIQNLILTASPSYPSAYLFL